MDSATDEGGSEAKGTADGGPPYRQLIENAHDGIAIIQDEQFVYCNDRFAELLGTTPEELVEQPFLSLVAEEEREIVADRYERRLGGDSPPHQYRLTTDAGHIVEVSGTRITYRSEPASMAVIRDVTEQERYETTLIGLHEVTQEFPYAETKAEIATLAVEKGKNILDVASLHVCLLNEDEGHLETVATNYTADSTVETAEPVFEPDDNPVWTAFASGEKNWIDSSDCKRLASSEEVTGILVVPLGDHGVLFVETTSGERDDQRFELVETLAATTTAALDRAEKEGALRQREGELEAVADRFEHVKEKVELYRRVVRLLQTNQTQTEIEQTVCSTFVEHSEFDFAWIGHVDRQQETLEPRAVAGNDHGYLTDNSLSLGADSDEPVVVAHRRGELQAVGDTMEYQQTEPWRRSAARRGFRSAFGVPLRYDGVMYGVLGLYGPDSSWTGEFERELLTDCGNVVGTSLNAIERRRAVIAERSAELDFEIADLNCFLYQFATDADCSLTFDGIIPASPGEDLMHLQVEGDEGATERFRESAARSSVVTHLHSLDSDTGDTSFEIGLATPFVGSVLAAHGLTLVRLQADRQSARVTVGIPISMDMQRAIDIVETRYPSATLRAKRTMSRRDAKNDREPRQILDRLTERQREVFEHAYRSGYFDTPKGKSGTELATALGISSSTFHDHLRRAQQRIFEAFIED